MFCESNYCSIVIFYISDNISRNLNLQETRDIVQQVNNSKFDFKIYFHQRFRDDSVYCRMSVHLFWGLENDNQTKKIVEKYSPITKN